MRLMLRRLLLHRRPLPDRDQRPSSQIRIRQVDARPHLRRGLVELAPEFARELLALCSVRAKSYHKTESTEHGSE